MTVQQTFATLGRSTVPLIAAAIVADLHVDPALVGVYVAIGAVAGFLTTMGCGGLIVRYGAMRMTQIGMLALAVGLALPASGWLALFALGAFVGGLGQALSTPSSSHLLGRLSPPRLAPLVFSIKQTGVPAGLMVAGVVAPVLATEAGWRTALLVIAGLSALTAVALQPLRARFDVDRVPGTSLSPADIRANVASVLREPALRAMCLAMFSFVGLQSLFTGFFVLYLVRGLGYDLERAGLVFAIAVAVAVPARIGWGWLAARLVRPATLLVAARHRHGGLGRARRHHPTRLADLARDAGRHPVQRHGRELARRAAGGSGAPVAGRPHRRHDRRGAGLRRRRRAGAAAAVQRRADADGQLRAGVFDRWCVYAGGRVLGRVASHEPAGLRHLPVIPSGARSAEWRATRGFLKLHR